MALFGFGQSSGFDDPQYNPQQQLQIGLLAPQREMIEAERARKGKIEEARRLQMSPEHKFLEDALKAYDTGNVNPMQSTYLQKRGFLPEPAETPKAKTEAELLQDQMASLTRRALEGKVVKRGAMGPHAEGVAEASEVEENLLRSKGLLDKEKEPESEAERLRNEIATMQLNSEQRRQVIVAEAEADGKITPEEAKKLRLYGINVGEVKTEEEEEEEKQMRGLRRRGAELDITTRELQEKQLRDKAKDIESERAFASSKEEVDRMKLAQEKLMQEYLQSLSAEERKELFRQRAFGRESGGSDPAAQLQALMAVVQAMRERKK